MTRRSTRQVTSMNPWINRCGAGRRGRARSLPPHRGHHARRGPRLTLAVMLISGLGVIACGTKPSPSESTASQPPAGGGAAPAPVANAAAAEPRAPADLFPPGEGRDLVVNNCTSCHNLACAAIGQRSSERWEALKASHREHVGDVNLDVLFGYLKANFGADKPEPKVPPHFLEGGCTPY